MRTSFEPASLIGFASFDWNIRSLSASIRLWCLADERKRIYVASPRERMSCSGLRTSHSLLPVLNQEVVERYAIPPSSAATITHTGLPLDAIEDALQRSVAMQNARGILVRKHQKMTGRPVTPLHKGHVGLLACSGMLNGFFGEGETRHIAHWRSVKYVDEFNEEGEAEGETIIRKRERFSHELTLAYESGQIIELKETKEEKVPNRSAE